MATLTHTVTGCQIECCDHRSLSNPRVVLLPLNTGPQTLRGLRSHRGSVTLSFVRVTTNLVLPGGIEPPILTQKGTGLQPVLPEPIGSSSAKVAASLGVEPRSKRSERSVLPLNDEAIKVVGRVGFAPTLTTRAVWVARLIIAAPAGEKDMG